MQLVIKVYAKVTLFFMFFQVHYKSLLGYHGLIYH
jgi:hypothetical protein